MASQLATILVTDLVGSTDLRSRLGEEAADRLHRFHERLLRDVVEGHNGVVVKGLGDGVLASFTGAADAVAAAVAAQQAADSHSKRHPDEMLVLRVGLSAGLPDVLSTAMFDMFWLVSHFYAAIAVRSGTQDRALARTIYERLLPYRTLHATYLLGYLGPVEIALGACARTLGDVEAADAHHGAAAATIERCGAVRARALNDYLWALALLDHDTPEARGRAVELLNETRKASEAHGYVTLLQRADELLAR